MNIIVWHRRDLRTFDNRALFEASIEVAKDGGFVIPVFVLDSTFFESSIYCKSRLVFLKESLEDLVHQYQRLGLRLVILEGEPLHVLQKLSAKLKAKIFFNEDTNSEYGIERDKQAVELGFVGFCNDAIQRQGRTADWGSEAQRYFEGDQYMVSQLSPHNVTGGVELTSYFANLDIAHDKVTNQRGGSEEAYTVVKEFTKKIRSYPKHISSPLDAETGTSRLSTHFSFGTISTRTVYQAIDALPYKQKRFYISRLFWNQHFTQKLANNPTLVNVSANPVFVTHYDQLYIHDEGLIEAWKQGLTGYPLVDASMRALNQTGFLNFRMRAMVASFFSFILRQNWKIGADYMFSQLIDADTAINYSQWQMQTGQVGVHPNRIYNPTTQLRQYDSNAEFVRKYIPELKEASTDDILRDPEHPSDSLFGYSYIQPVVIYSERLKEARALYSEINKEAFALVQRDKSVRSKMGLEEVSNDRLDKNKLPETKEV